MKLERSKVILIVIVLFVGFILFNFIYSLSLPKIELIGDSEVIVNYNTKYQDKGFIANYKGKSITNKVKVSGSVNTKKLGKYVITYEVKKGGFSKKVRRIVLVRDRIKPKISVNDANDIYTCPGNSYDIPKYKAYDNYDGDITDKVVVIKRNDAVIFEVKDSSGNKEELIKKVIYKDVEAPKLKLIGKDSVTIFLNDEYVEEGYTVSDNCDDSVEKNVGVVGFVDTKKVGEYKLTYSVEDKYGNKTEIKRNVSVIDKSGKGLVFLTFDDGPQYGTTDAILDILKEETVKATFFVTSKGPDELIKREYDEGHELALHTATHDYSYVYSSVDNYFNDLNDVHDRVKRITDYDARIIRFPGGSSNTISRRYAPGIMSVLTDEVEKRNFKYCDWNIMSGDAGDTKDPNEIYQRVTSSLSHDRSNIILMHDIKPYTRDALRSIIKYGKENGYKFSKLNYDGDMIHQRVNN